MNLVRRRPKKSWFKDPVVKVFGDMGMGQYLLIPFLVG
jgi:hypothetical protein